MRFTIVLLILVWAAACGGSTANNGGNSAANGSKPASRNATFEIVKTYPHDPGAFTQGLLFHNGFLYEGTGGRKGESSYTSSLRRVELTTGKVLQKYELPPEYFGEGLALLSDQLYQLTWREGTAFVYGLNDFKLIREFRYSGDGWGLTTDKTHLIMSDGTHVLRFVDPETFQTVRTLAVNDENGKPLMKINELEYIKGEIWANIWETGWIVRIDPKTGKLLGRINLTKLVTAQNGDMESVLNGIAYDEAGDRIFVTGKLWKNLYEIKIVEQ